MSCSQCLKRESVQGWAALAIPKSWEYAYLRREALLRGPAMALPFSCVSRFCSPFLALVQVPRWRGLTESSSPSTTALAPALPCSLHAGPGVKPAGVRSLPAAGRVGHKRPCGLHGDLLCFCWNVPYCCKFSTKYSVVCFVTSLL